MKLYSFFLGGSRRIPDLKDIARTSSLNEDNIEVAMNKYGIQTEYSGIVHVNVNVAIQSNDVLEAEKKAVRDKAGKETYKLFTHIEENLRGEDTFTDEMNEKVNTMNTKYFGAINRHEGNN
jgi:hypothetical protein